MPAFEDDDRYSKILKRLDSLERRLAELEQPAAAAVQSPAPPPWILADPAPAPVELLSSGLPESETRLKEPSKSAGIESRFGLTLLNRIGVVTLVLGVAFFFKWAADNNWVGPLGRVLLGLLAGSLTLALADYLWRKAQQVFAQGISGTGLAVLYLSFYAAFDFYHLIPQPLAFAFLLAVTALAVALAQRYVSPAIAALGFVGAYIIPLLLSDGSDRPWFLIFYLIAINFAVAHLAARNKWRHLEVLSFAATLVIFGWWTLRHGAQAENHWAATFGLLAFCAQRFFTSVPILFVFTQVLCAAGVYVIWPRSEPFTSLSLLIAASGLAFGVIRKYPVIAGTAFTAFWLFVERWLQQGETLSLKPVAFLGFLLFYCWFWWRTVKSREPSDVPAVVVFALNGLCFFGIAYQSLHEAHHEWLGLLAVLVALSYLALAAYTQRQQQEDHSAITVLSLALCALFLTLAILIQFSGLTITIAWSIQAAAFVWIGVRLSSFRTMAAGAGVFLMAFLKAFLVDAWRLEDFATARIAFNTTFLTFLLLGAGLLCASYWLRTINRKLSLAHFAFGHAALLTGLSIEVLRWAHRSVQPEDWLSRETISISILFALYSVVLVGIGVAAQSLANRAAGLLLTAIVIVKLYLFDVWQLGRGYQIVAFVILGVLLLSTSFLYSRFKELIGEWRGQG